MKWCTGFNYAFLIQWFDRFIINWVKYFWQCSNHSNLWITLHGHICNFSFHLKGVLYFSFRISSKWFIVFISFYWQCSTNFDRCALISCISDWLSFLFSSNTKALLYCWQQLDYVFYLLILIAKETVWDKTIVCIDNIYIFEGEKVRKHCTLLLYIFYTATLYLVN